MEKSSLNLKNPRNSISSTFLSVKIWLNSTLTEVKLALKYSEDWGRYNTIFFDTRGAAKYPIEGCIAVFNNNLLLGSFHSQYCGFQKGPTKIKNTRYTEQVKYNLRLKNTMYKTNWK